MWRAALYLMFIWMLSSTARGDFPRLETPTRLRVGRDSNTSAVVFWNFLKPENVSLSRIEFILLLETKSKPWRKLYSRVSGRPFKFQLRNLELATRYKVSISASSPNWRNSHRAVIYFTFQGLELPTNVTVQLTKEQRKKNLEKLAARKNFPILGAPTKLTFGQESDSSVVVLWDFVKPKNVSLSKIEFVLLLDSEGKPTRKFYPKFRELPFEYRLRGLTSMTRYSLKLSATSPNWRDSPAVALSFVTRAFDWPTPVITDVKGMQRENSVEYGVRWQVQPLDHWLEYFDVEVCAGTCHQYRRGRDEVFATVPIKYKTSFSIRVIATYNIPVVNQVKRYSRYYNGNTGVGSVGRVLRSIRAEQEGNRVKLGWLPSYAPDGPLSYYDVFVCDMGFAQRRAGSVALARSPGSLVGDVFEMNLDVKYGLTSPSADLESGQCSSQTPPLLVVIKRTEAAVRFRVAFRDPYNERDDIFDPSWNAKHLRFGTGVAEAFGLSEDAPLSIKIRSCLIYPGETVNMCGNFSDFVLPPNVGEPSRVPFLTWFIKDNETAVVTWQKPEVPRGPIAGYKIAIRKIIESEPDAVETLLTLNSSTRSFVLNPFHAEITYEIGVVAFNIDLEDFTEVIGEDWSYLTVKEPWLNSRRLQIIFLCYTVISLSFICSCLLPYANVKVRNELETSHYEVPRGSDDSYPEIPPRPDPSLERDISLSSFIYALHQQSEGRANPQIYSEPLPPKDGSEEDDGRASPHIYLELLPPKDGSEEDDGRASPHIYLELLSPKDGSEEDDGRASPHIYLELLSPKDGSEEDDGRASPHIYLELLSPKDGSEEDDGRASPHIYLELLPGNDETGSQQDAEIKSPKIYEKLLPRNDETGVLQEEGGSQQEEGGSQQEEGGSQQEEGGSQQEEGGSQQEEGGSQQEEGGSQQEKGGSQRDDDRAGWSEEDKALQKRLDALLS